MNEALSTLANKSYGKAASGLFAMYLLAEMDEAILVFITAMVVLFMQGIIEYRTGEKK